MGIVAIPAGSRKKPALGFFQGKEISTWAINKLKKITIILTGSMKIAKAVIQQEVSVKLL